MTILISGLLFRATQYMRRKTTRAEICSREVGPGQRELKQDVLNELHGRDVVQV